MPFRYLLISGLICVVIACVKRHRQRTAMKYRSGSAGPIRMVRCQFCGVHLASRDAVTLPAPPGSGAAPRYYCTLEHAKQDQLTPS